MRFVGAGGVTLMLANGCAKQPTAVEARAAPVTEQLYARLSGSVVTVETFVTHLKAIRRPTPALDDLGEFDVVRYEKPVATGSGVIVAEGKVVTNWHVLAPGHGGDVITSDGRRLRTDGVECDVPRDLCLLSINRLGIRPVQVGSAATLRVGLPTYAIGSPLGLSQSLSQGIVSGIRRDNESWLIQTTAAISPGSSGGGLFDAEGVLIGITVSKAVEGELLGFALPADWIREIPSRVERGLRNESAARAKYEATCRDLGILRMACDSAPDMDQCVVRLARRRAGFDWLAGEKWVVESPVTISGRTCAADLAEVKGDMDSAVRYAGEAARLRPTPDVLVEVGHALRRRADSGRSAAGNRKPIEDYQAAVVFLRRATVADPEEADAWAELAYTLFNAGDKQGASEAVAEAIKIDPQNDTATLVAKMLEVWPK